MALNVDKRAHRSFNEPIPKLSAFFIFDHAEEGFFFFFLPSSDGGGSIWETEKDAECAMMQIGRIKAAGSSEMFAHSPSA